MKRAWAVLAIMVLSMIFACISCISPGSGTPEPPRIGAPAPRFTIGLLGEDQGIEFPTDLGGEAVALSFFSPG